jgi:hypothetical protein
MAEPISELPTDFWPKSYLNSYSNLEIKTWGLWGVKSLQSFSFEPSGLPGFSQLLQTTYTPRTTLNFKKNPSPKLHLWYKPLSTNRLHKLEDTHHTTPQTDNAEKLAHFNSP